jgi:hypothetical protein
VGMRRLGKLRDSLRDIRVTGWRRHDERFAVTASRRATARDPASRSLVENFGRLFPR